MILLDLNKSELESFVERLGEPKYRASQLFDCIYSGKDYSDKTNLSQQFVDKLHIAGAIMQPLKIQKAIESKAQKNVKFLYKLNDGNVIEGMLMKYKFGCSLCVSTQIGCKMNCAFCASGLNGWVRNLTAGEILGQVVSVNRYLGGNKNDRKITNVVLMGTGEPLDNFDSVVKFLKLLNSPDGFNISVRNISVSTCGIPSKIEALADIGLPVTLCISLHAPNDEIRRQIMPIAKSYNIDSVLESAKYFSTISSRRVIIEYTLIDNVNNSSDDARQLAELLRGLDCHVNLIKLNEVKERGLRAPSNEDCEKFLNLLTRLGVSVTMRRTIGDDVEGACGQLRNANLKNTKSDPNVVDGVSNIQRKFDNKKEKSFGDKKRDSRYGKRSSSAFAKGDYHNKKRSSLDTRNSDRYSDDKRTNYENKKTSRYGKSNSISIDREKSYDRKNNNDGYSKRGSYSKRSSDSREYGRDDSKKTFGHSNKVFKKSSRFVSSSKDKNYGDKNYSDKKPYSSDSYGDKKSHYSNKNARFNKKSESSHFGDSKRNSNKSIKKFSSHGNRSTNRLGGGISGRR